MQVNGEQKPSTASLSVGALGRLRRCVAAEPLDLTAPMASGRGPRGVLGLLKQPASKRYMLCGLRATLLAIISRQDFGICF